ncbi:hypothetical protein Syun_021884 [Stephania yunnanensis]|uniref:Uncharacterized protein n=1 Tax=Stephania yunnanensis TaxID=152371 RepID=A0AAP0NPI4_9MAGN
MAQREKEETEFKVPEALTLCVNNCGFAGNPATNNMCQACFKASLSLPPPSSSSSRCAASIDRSDRLQAEGKKKVSLSSKVMEDLEATEATEAKKMEVVPRREVNRCLTCRRKVGLTGFRCRCGDLFCSDHRYSDRHDCSFDYKAAGREAIARENPVVRAAKIIRV